MKNRIIVAGFLAILCSLSNNGCKMKMSEKINELAVLKRAVQRFSLMKDGVFTGVMWNWLKG